MEFSLQSEFCKPFASNKRVILRWLTPIREFLPKNGNGAKPGNWPCIIDKKSRVTHIVIKLHRRWWRMLETKCVGDNFEMFVTALTVFVTNILYLLTSGMNTQKVSPTSTCHQCLCNLVILILGLFWFEIEMVLYKNEDFCNELWAVLAVLSRNILYAADGG